MRDLQMPDCAMPVEVPVITQAYAVMIPAIKRIVALSDIALMGWYQDCVEVFAMASKKPFPGAAPPFTAADGGSKKKKGGKKKG